MDQVDRQSLSQLKKIYSEHNLSQLFTGKCTHMTLSKLYTGKLIDSKFTGSLHRISSRPPQDKHRHSRHQVGMVSHLNPNLAVTLLCRQALVVCVVVLDLHPRTATWLRCSLSLSDLPPEGNDYDYDYDAAMHCNPPH